VSDTDAAAPVHATVEELIRARLIDAVGGVRGSVESALPLLGYVVAWSATKDLRLSFAVAGGLCLLLGLVALVQRRRLRFVAYGLLGVAVAAFFVRLTGRAEGAFLPGILKNVGLAALYAVTNALRWPAVGFLAGVADPDFDKDPLAWRRHDGMVSVAQRLTWVLVGLFAVRAVVMAPMYAAGWVAALGVASIALGWPLWAAAVALMGAMLARGHTPLEHATVEE
jgi:hypothetical protein